MIFRGGKFCGTRRGWGRRAATLEGIDAGGAPAFLESVADRCAAHGTGPTHLGEDFELDFVDGTLTFDAASAEEVWELFSSSAPPVLALLDRLDEEGAAGFHRAFVDLYEGYREGDRLHVPRRYLLVLGRRR